MNYYEYKSFIIKHLKNLNANLLRDDKDLDFGLLNKKKKEEIVNFLLNEGFCWCFNTKEKMNFKKFIDCKLLDIDIDLEINNSYLKQFFYDIEIKRDFERRYFENPTKNQIGMKTLRYFLLLRGYDRKYLNFIISHKNEIIKNNFYFDFLTRIPFRKKIDFETFLKIIQRDIFTILLYLKYRYIFYFVYKKIVNKFKRKGELIAFLGVDGSGKTTIINILSKELGYRKVYLGDSSIRFANFYNKKYLKPVSFLIQFFEKFFRVLSLKLSTFRGNTVLCDRFYFYERNKNDSFLKRVVYDFLYNKIFIKPGKIIVLWNDVSVILKRKQEISEKEIEEFNKNIEKLPFKDIIKVKNDDLNETLNKILKKIK
jgi:thymidylate kinase